MNKVQMALGNGMTSEIGKDLAKIFDEEDFQPIIGARDWEELDDTAIELEALSEHAFYPIAKVHFNPEAAFEIYNKVKAINQAIDLLVKDAGQGYYAEFAGSDLRCQLATIQQNVCHLVSNTHLFLEDFLAQGAGKILSVPTVTSKTPGPWQAVYHATKAFVLSAQLSAVE